MQVDPKEINTKWYEANLQVTRELGLYSIKTLVTLNSGAIVVLLTFLGNAAAQTQYTLNLYGIKNSLLSFLVGIASAALVVAVAYVDSMRMSPYGNSKTLKDSAALTIYVSLSLVSFACFILGVLIVISGVVET
jgi:uncharacterized membrane protein YidH (DUF202 family)